jgi:OmpR-family two-component system manganese-sensing response regulator
MAKILVIEDDADLLKTIRQCLEFEHFVVETSQTGQEGLHRLRAYSYDLILLDWQLPDMTGVEICRELRTRHSVTPVLMMTAKSAVDDKETAFDSGVDDYLTKPFNLKELVIRIRAILRRGPLIATDHLIELCGLIMDTRAIRLTCNDQEVRLIPKEFSILELLMRHPGQIFSPEQIVARVWHSDEDASPAVVRGHIKNLRKKLEKHDKENVVVTVHGFGYKSEAAGRESTNREKKNDSSEVSHGSH